MRYLTLLKKLKKKGHGSVGPPLEGVSSGGNSGKSDGSGSPFLAAGGYGGKRSGGSVGPRALRSKRAEDLIRGQSITDDLIEAAARLSAEDAQPTTDINGSEEYKRELVQVLVTRSIKEAVRRGLTP